MRPSTRTSRYCTSVNCVLVDEEVMSAGAEITPFRVAWMLLPFTSSARWPACVAVSPTPGALVQELIAAATKASACAPERIGLKSPWSVKYPTEELVHTRGCPSTPGL